MSGPFVHDIDPVIGQVGGLYLWWYGVSYSLGFLEMHLWMRRQRARLGLGVDDVYRLSVWFAAGVLIGGRAIEIAFDEWPFYRGHVWLMPALWLGGMATHGLLIGGATSASRTARRLPDGRRPGRELHRRADCRGRHRRALGRAVPRRRGLQTPGRALRRGQEPGADPAAAVGPAPQPDARPSPRSSPWA